MTNSRSWILLAATCGAVLTLSMIAYYVLGAIVSESLSDSISTIGLESETRDGLLRSLLPFLISTSFVASVLLFMRWQALNRIK